LKEAKEQQGEWKSEVKSLKEKSETYRKEVSSMTTKISSFESLKSKHSKCQDKIDELKIERDEYKRANQKYDKRILRQVVKIQKLTGKDYETSGSEDEWFV